jgi:hypothetical protein
MAADKSANLRGGPEGGGTGMKKLLIAVAAVVWVAGLAGGIDLPPMKEGLWSIHTQSIDNPGNVKREFSQKICRNHAYDDAARAKAKNMPGCKVLNENLSGQTYTIEMECTISGSVLHSKGVTTRTGEESFRSENHATYTPALHGVSESTMIMEQKYEGSCPAGTEPGDIIRADGTILHTGKR